MNYRFSPSFHTILILRDFSSSLRVVLDWTIIFIFRCTFPWDLDFHQLSFIKKTFLRSLYFNVYFDRIQTSNYDYFISFIVFIFNGIFDLLEHFYSLWNLILYLDIFHSSLIHHFVTLWTGVGSIYQVSQCDTILFII